MKKILLFLVLLALSTSLIACGGVEEGVVKASAPEGYTLISAHDATRGILEVYQHIGTKCYYTFMDGSYSGAFTQMFVEKDGVSVPYCEEVIK